MNKQKMSFEESLEYGNSIIEDGYYFQNQARDVLRKGLRSGFLTQYQIENLGEAFAILTTIGAELHQKGVAQ